MPGQLDGGPITDRDVTNMSKPEGTADLRRGMLRIGLIRTVGVVGSVALATLVRLPLGHLLGDRMAFTLFYLSVIFSAWLAGWPGGLLATILSGVCATYFFLPTPHRLSVHHFSDLFSLVVFSLVSVVICWVSQAQHRAQRQAEKAARTARQHELSLAASEKRYQAILDSTTDGLLLSDMTGHVVAANPAAAQILGFEDSQDLCVSQTAMASQTLLFGLDSKPLAPSDWPLSRALRMERFANLELKLKRLDTGEERFASYSGTPVIDENGQPQFALVTLRDITDLKQTQLDLSRAFERESLLNRIGQAIRSATDPAEIEAISARGLCEALRADRCFFTSLDLAYKRLTVQNDWRVKDLPGLAGTHSLDEQEALALARAFRRSGTLSVVDTSTAKVRLALRSLVERSGCRSLMMVPLFEDKELIAFLTVGMVEQARVWNAEEIALAEAAAAHSRSAVQSVRIRQKEHWIATMLQEALQPRLPSRVGCLDLADHYTAALDEASVGGDFYDVFDLEPGLWALVVGDVSGKGLIAAAQVAMVRNMLRGTLYQGRFLSEALTTLNRILTEHDLLKGFVTLFVAIYREQTGTVVHASCGHEPALLYQAETGEVVPLESSGPPLGIDPGAVYHDTPIRLQPGDALLVYTDGFSEAGPTRARMLGTEGLLEIFRDEIAAGENLEAVRERIIARVREYAESDLKDDACLLLARRKP